MLLGVIMLITSLDNNKIKKYIKLKTKKYRDLEKMFLIEGEHLVKEALSCNLLVDLLVLEDNYIDIDFNFTYVTKNIMKKLSDMDSVPRVVGVVKFFEPNLDFSNKVLMLDDIQDPGNLGTIIRSSVAFGVKDIILNLNSVDIYNDKVIRSSQGMIFKVNIIRCDLKDVIFSLKERNYKIFGTDVLGGVDARSIKENKFALIMGNEGKGVKKELLELCDKNLYIKMNPECESLNVGVATSILLYTLNGDL